MTPLKTAERVLTTDQVQIQTATVEVKVMRIGKRQMTQSVFRQLPERDIVDGESGRLRVQPWGRINYFWNGCTPSCEHLHVVWAEEGKLFRSCVYSPRMLTPRAVAMLRKTLNKYESQLFAMACVGFCFWAEYRMGPLAEEFQNFRVTLTLPHDLAYRIDTANPYHEMPDAARQCLNATHSALSRRLHTVNRSRHNTSQGEERVDEWTDRLSRLDAGTTETIQRQRYALLHAMFDYMDPDAVTWEGFKAHQASICQEYLNTKHATHTLEAQFNATYAELCAVEQLFIAV